MGAVPSTPRWGSSSAARPLETAEYLIGTFVGDESFPLSSDYWQKLLDLPLSLQWPPDRVQQACEALAQNNYKTRHLAKLLIHLAWCLQEAISTSGGPSLVYGKAVNAVYISSVFLKYLIENPKSDKLEELYLSLYESEPMPTDITRDLNIEDFVMCSVLTFIGSIDQCLRLLDKNVLLKGSRYLSDNPYCKALEHATDVEFDRVDTEGNGRSGPVLRYLTDEAAALLLYSLLQGNADYLECVLVRTDLDTLLMPILEALYDAPKRTSNQIYMLLIILLILRIHLLMQAFTN